MKLMLPLLNWKRMLGLAALGLALGHAPWAGAGVPRSAADRQPELIRVLQSDAAPGDKAIACKRLAVYGTAGAVPSLAPLLGDADLSSWARIALEAIPGVEADEALRDALEKVEGRLLVGVINSIGVRGDLQAIRAVGQHLTHADTEVASAAAEALGQLGGESATELLGQRLDAEPSVVRSAVAEGLIMCAEGYLARGDAAEAIRWYDAVRAADLPKQRLIEATRGAIVARGSAGLPLLLEQLRSSDLAMMGLGLRVARELPGVEVSYALADELDRSPAERQVLVLAALADRDDAAVLPAILGLAQTGSAELRTVAVQRLDELGDVSCVPVLLDAATDENVELAAAATMALARLGGSEVDERLTVLLAEADGSARVVLIKLVAQRHVVEALAVLRPYLTEGTPEVNRAAVQAVGMLGDRGYLRDLVPLFQRAAGSRERRETEQAILAIAGRVGEPCVPQGVALTKSADSSLRVLGLRLLATVGGAEGVQAVSLALDDADEVVQDEAVRVLSTWPGNWPDDGGVGEPLLALAHSGKRASHKIQGTRGYLQFVRENREMSDDEKLVQVKDLIPIMQRPEEKRLAISVLGNLGTAGALDLLMNFAADTAVREEACLAIVGLASKDDVKGASRELRKRSLDLVVAESKNDRTQRKAREVIKLLR